MKLFNPSKGNLRMSYKEWLMRHPGRKSSADAAGDYREATGEEGGKKFQAQNPNWQNMNPDRPQSMNFDRHQTGGNKPKLPVGGTYKQFVKTHGGKSTAALAAKWRGANGMDLSPKMAAAAKRRNIARPTGAGGGSQRVS